MRVSNFWSTDRKDYGYIHGKYRKSLNMNNDLTYIYDSGDISFHQPESISQRLDSTSRTKQVGLNLQD